MLVRSIVLCLLLIGAMVPQLRAVVTRSQVRAFTREESAVGLLKVDIYNGNIRVDPGEFSEVKVIVRTDFITDSDALVSRISANLRILVGVSDGALFVKAEYGRDMHWTFEEWPPVRLMVTVQVPTHYNLDLHTKDGGITVGRIFGNVKVRTHAGEIFLNGVDGNAEAYSESGDITISHCTKDLRIKSDAAYFKVGPVGGLADVQASGGEIEIEDGGKGLRAEVVGNELSVIFRGKIAGDCSLAASGGGLRLGFAASTACQLDLRASVFGRIKSIKGPLLMTIEDGGLGRRSIKASLNGGGPLIRGTVSGGHIELLREEELR